MLLNINRCQNSSNNFVLSLYFFLLDVSFCILTEQTHYFTFKYWCSRCYLRLERFMDNSRSAK